MISEYPIIYVWELVLLKKFNINQLIHISIFYYQTHFNVLKSESINFKC